MLSIYGRKNLVKNDFKCVSATCCYRYDLSSELYDVCICSKLVIPVIR